MKESKKKEIKILVVDHSEKAAKALGRSLGGEPAFSVEGYALNGYEAITKVLRLAPQIVLMNVRMENDMTAASVCREICSAAPDIRVILFGKPSSNEIVYKAFQMGVCNFLVEDYTTDDLIQSVLDAAADRPSIHFSSAKLLREKTRSLMSLEDNLTYLLNVITKLTPAELNILRLVYSGMRYQEVATVLFISPSTMKTHISHILKKFNLETLSQVLELLHSTELFSIIMLSDGSFE
jgi:DNA-binding NarL/FixJ family response regulator